MITPGVKLNFFCIAGIIERKKTEYVEGVNRRLFRFICYGENAIFVTL
jgi:hypothetical protein